MLSQQATAQARELPGATSSFAFVLHYTGWVALTLGAYGEAESLLQESVVLHRQSSGSTRWSPHCRLLSPRQHRHAGVCWTCGRPPPRSTPS